MFSDAVKTSGADDRLLVRDITSLIDEAVAKPVPPGLVEVTV